MYYVRQPRIKHARLQILPEFIHDIVKPNRIWLAGGALRSLINGELPNDYDLFFYHELEAENTFEKLERWNFKCIFTCPEGSLKTFVHRYNRNIKVQCITKFYYTDIELPIDSFDFTACCACYDGSTLTMHDDFIRDNKKMVLNINVVTHPKATFKRIMKYADKGFFINNAIEQYLVRVNAMGSYDPQNDYFYID